MKWYWRMAWWFKQHLSSIQGDCSFILSVATNGHHLMDHSHQGPDSRDPAITAMTLEYAKLI